MKIEYRIAYRNGECFPHARINKIGFWNRWKKIAKHCSGYGLYGLPDTNYPKTEIECKTIIIGFNDWMKEKSNLNEAFSI